MKTLGILLIVVGLLTTIFTGFNFFTEKKVLDVGRLEVTKDEKHTVNWPPYVGVGFMILGGALLVFTSRKSRGAFVSGGILLLGITSCNSMKDGCYTGQNSYQQFDIASSIQSSSVVQEANLLPVEANYIEAKAITDSFNGLEPVAVTPSDNVLLLAEIPSTGEGNPQQASLATLMAADLRIGAASIENRFVTRVLNRTANKLETKGFTENTGKVTLVDKIKMKIANKYVSKHAAAAAGDGGVLAIVSLITGILAFAAYYGSFALGLVAIITGAIALSQGTSRRVMAILGIVFGALAIAMWSGLIVVF